MLLTNPDRLLVCNRCCSCRCVGSVDLAANSWIFSEWKGLLTGVCDARGPPPVASKLVLLRSSSISPNNDSLNQKSFFFFFFFFLQSQSEKRGWIADPQWHVTLLQQLCSLSLPQPPCNSSRLHRMVFLRPHFRSSRCLRIVFTAHLLPQKHDLSQHHKPRMTA